MVVAILFSPAPLIAAILFYSCRRLAPLLKSSSHVTLSFSPTQLTRGEIGFVLFLFLSRSFSYSLYTIWRRVTYQSSPSEFVRSDVDPGIKLSMPLQTTHHDLADYVRAVQTKSVDSFQWNTIQLAMALSAWSEPAMLLLLATRNCKIRPLGAVNVRNRLELLRPDLCNPEALGHIDKAILSASSTKLVRKVKRGLEIDLTVSLDIPDTNGRLTTVFRQVFTMLQFTNTLPVPPETSISVQKNPTWQRAGQATFSMQHREPSCWAKVCKDYNPIHTSAMAAKLFGFPGKLAHGNHVAAKAWVALMGAETMRDHNALPTNFEALWLELSFKRPIILPARLDALYGHTFLPNGHLNATDFQVVSKDKVRLAGTIGILK